MAEGYRKDNEKNPSGIPVSLTRIYSLFIGLSAAFRSNILPPTGLIIIHRIP